MKQVKKITNIGQIPTKTLNLKITPVDLVILKACLEMYEDMLDDMETQQEVDEEIAYAMRLVVEPLNKNFDEMLSAEGLENLKGFFEGTEGSMQ